MTKKSVSKTENIHVGEPYRDVLKFSHYAMATIFDIFIFHSDKEYARQAAFAAFTELDRLEQLLSRFIENSDISKINSLSAGEWATVNPDVFECLQQCKLLSQKTHGVFDITIGPLMDYWKKHAESGYSKTELTKILEHIGIRCFEYDSSSLQIKVLCNDLCIDLGGYGKGFALDQMAKVLCDWEIESALINGGCSTILVLSSPPSKPGWKVTVSHPETNEIIDFMILHQTALSASGLQKGQHIMDPRTGFPTTTKLATWSTADSAARSDALSTAFMVMSLLEIEEYFSGSYNEGACILLKAPLDSNKEDLYLFGNWSQLSQKIRRKE